VSKTQSLNDTVARCLERYFKDLDGNTPCGVYEMVIQAVERPMLEIVMRQSDHNQLRASAILGINRNTLRKKLQNHGLLNNHE
jgi:Fis family transcriptional regulator